MIGFGPILFSFYLPVLKLCLSFDKYNLWYKKRKNIPVDLINNFTIKVYYKKAHGQEFIIALFIISKISVK